MTEVMIGVQARSGSKRLPGKSLEIIDDAIMVEHVLNAAKSSAYYFNNRRSEYGLNVTSCLLIPIDDPLKEELAGSFIVEGSEDNVLSRYAAAAQKYNAEYIVRVTGDCPLLLPTIITKHIISSINYKLDYCSNSFDELRTYIDGYDVEVLSRRMLNWLSANAESRHDKEHVTTLCKRQAPPWAKFGVLIGHLDLSHVKLSVDTKDELDAVRKNKESLKSKLDLAKEKGMQIFRF